MALAYSASGWSGVRLLTAVMAAATMALLAAEQRRSLGVLSVIASLGLSFTVLARHLPARPAICSVALPLMVLWMVELLNARRIGRPPPLWLLPLMMLWANLPGSYDFRHRVHGLLCSRGLFMAGKGRRLVVAAQWGGFLIAATAMALITPNGLVGLIYPIEVISLKNLQSIGEWWRAMSFGQVVGIWKGLDNDALYLPLPGGQGSPPCAWAFCCCCST